MLPYKGYIEANLNIPDLPQFNEEVLFLVILDHKYGKKVPVQIGTQVIDHLVVTMTEGIATGWGNLDTGISQHCNFQKEYCEGSECCQV